MGEVRGDTMPSILKELLVDQVHNIWRPHYNSLLTFPDRHRLGDEKFPTCGWIGKWSGNGWEATQEIPRYLVFGENPGSPGNDKQRNNWRKAWGNLVNGDQVFWDQIFTGLVKSNGAFWNGLRQRGEFREIRTEGAVTLFFNGFPYLYSSDGKFERSQEGTIAAGTAFVCPFIQWFRTKNEDFTPGLTWILGKQAAALFGAGQGRLVRHPSARGNER